MRHVLVVDDEPAICGLVQSALELDGACRVTSAATSDEALGILDRDPPDAAIIDAVLKGGSGIDLADKALGRGVPVLLVTGEPGTRAQLEALGCPYLGKPFHLRDLIAETRALLDDATQRRGQLALLLRQTLEKREALEAAVRRSWQIVSEARRNRASRSPERQTGDPPTASQSRGEDPKR